MEKKDLRGKKILITGAAGGFGQEFIRQFLEMGSQLILTGRNKSKLEATAKESTSSLPDVQGKILGLIEADFEDTKNCDEVYRRCMTITHEVDMLVNNAGIITYGNFYDVPRDKWESLVQIDLLSAMRLTYLFLPSMLKNGQGHIVFMSSIAGFVGTMRSAAYSASKFGLNGFGMSLYGEVHSKGVDVTIICPFWADTPILASADYGSKPTKKMNRFFVDSAEDVIKESINGIRRRKLFVYPGKFAKIIRFGSRFITIIGNQKKG